MSRRHPLLLVLVIALLPACKDKSVEDAGKAAVEVAPGKATPAAGEAEVESQSAAGETGETGKDEETETGEAIEQPPIPDEFEKVGVASCDEYVASYVACIHEKVPEADREAQRRIVFDNVSAWKQTAAGGGAAEKGLQTACKIATEQAKRATQDWGCAW